MLDSFVNFPDKREGLVSAAPDKLSKRNTQVESVVEVFLES